MEAAVPFAIPAQRAVSGVTEDSVLAARARDGDVQSFEALYRRHAGRIYALCVRLAGDPTAAEDCVQESFVRAWQALGEFRGDSAFGTWLHRIAVNTVFASQRTRLRRAAWVKEADDDLLETVPERQSDTAAEIDLERAIAGLPAGAREVFVLFLEGMSHEEIARLAGISVGTSKAQLHRARALLRRRLSL
jgi:RNA polymerase sigma-70 factor (ECF subfamily)